MRYTGPDAGCNSGVPHHEWLDRRQYSPIIAFAVALFAAGHISTLTGTMSGRVVMEGFLTLEMRPWLRRLMT